MLFLLLVVNAVPLFAAPPFEDELLAASSRRPTSVLTCWPQSPLWGYSPPISASGAMLCCTPRVQWLRLRITFYFFGGEGL